MEWPFVHMCLERNKDGEQEIYIAHISLRPFTKGFQNKHIISHLLIMNTELYAKHFLEFTLYDGCVK